MFVENLTQSVDPFRYKSVKAVNDSDYGQIGLMRLIYLYVSPLCSPVTLLLKIWHSSPLSPLPAQLRAPRLGYGVPMPRLLEVLRFRISVPGLSITYDKLI